MIRKATEKDIDAIEEIYLRQHALEECGKGVTGWKRDIYPTRKTATDSVRLGDMFVYERDGEIIACGRINREQVDVYASVPWLYKATDDEVMVLHTLCVSPDKKGKGVGTEFVEFYEAYARESGCTVLRIDTNERNIPARTLYRKLGYREAATVPCTFNGICGVGLVCIEKKL